MADFDLVRLGNWLNLLVAILVASIGLVSFSWSRLMKDRPFLKGVFAFWICQWLVFAITWWRIISIYPGKSDYWVLILGDLQSMLAIGFSVAFLFGEDFKKHWWTVVKGLVLTYVVLFLINLVASVGTLAGGAKSGEHFLAFFLGQWASTGQVVSLIANMLLGLAFVLRYGRLGLCMLAACVYYATLQGPIYSDLFGSPTAEPPYIRLGLAFGKALLGAIFYWLFFEPAMNYGRINIPLQPAPEFDWKGLVRRGGGLMFLAVVVVAIAFNFSRSVDRSSVVATVVSQLSKMLSLAGIIISLSVLTSRKLIQVHFVLNGRGITTKPGDLIYLTGNCRELGDWWPGKEIRGVPMDGTQYPIWTVDVNVPAQREIEFNFVKVGEGKPVWEEGGVHTYQVLDEGGQTVTRDWRHS